jgi:hypothetical protein
MGEWAVRAGKERKRDGRGRLGRAGKEKRRKERGVGRDARGKGRKGEERKWPAGLGSKERKEREKERKTKQLLLT